jgi:hypothetical protein
MRRTFLPARTERPRSGGGEYIITLPKLERPLWRGDSSGLCPRKEGKSTAIEKAFGALLRAWFSGALSRSDNGEGGPALFYLMTAAVGAGNPAFLMVCERQSLRECFLAGVTEELVVGHWDLRVVVKGSGWIV